MQHRVQKEKRGDQHLSSALEVPPIITSCLSQDFLLHSSGDQVSSFIKCLICLALIGLKVALWLQLVLEFLS
jgi:hypothetical protein